MSKSDSSALRVKTTPSQEKCEECGKAGPNLRWELAGIGSGVLCQRCLDAVVADINRDLKQK